MSGPTVAVVFQHIGPYHHARLNAAARHFRVVGVEWSAHDTFGWGRPGEASAYRKVSLFERCMRGAHAGSVLDSALSAAMEENRPDAVAVNGWGDFGSAITLRCCCRRKLPIVLMSESSAGDNRRNWLIEAIKSRVIKLSAAALVGGRAHAKYLAALGLSPEAISTGYDAVDNDHFARGADCARAEPGPLRQRWGLPANYFLASSRFIPKKNLMFLIRAYARYYASDRGESGDNAWKLLLLGDGPQRPDIEALARELHVAESLFMPGFKTYEVLPAYYGLAGAFLHASTTEQWGLVVNEAMASGLPVVVSDRCGCAGELLRHGENGFAFDPRDETGLADYMLQVAHDPVRRSAMGRRSRELIQDWGPERFGHGLRDAVQHALRFPARPRPWFALPLLGLLARRFA
jgi:glycosyltransferase involved in cell wall biosynthesis